MSVLGDLIVSVTYKL